MGNNYGTINIDPHGKLGTGKLGTVYRGTYKDESCYRECAVKVSL